MVVSFFVIGVLDLGLSSESQDRSFIRTSQGQKVSDPPAHPAPFVLNQAYPGPSQAQRVLRSRPSYSLARPLVWRNLHGCQKGHASPAPHQLRAVTSVCLANAPFPPPAALSWFVG